MSRAIKCDRCGDFFDKIDEYDQVRFLTLSAQDKVKTVKHYDLCPRCSELFQKWIEPPMYHSASEE